MSRHPGWSVWLLLCLALCGLYAADGAPPMAVPAGTVQSAFAEQFFNARVRPVLVEHCYECHGNGRHKGEVQLDSLAHVLEGGGDGPILVPGDAARSALITSIRWAAVDTDQNMPPKARLPDAAIADLTRWVDIGAPWPLATPPVSGGATSTGAYTAPATSEPAPHLPPLLGRLHPLIVHFPIACLLLAALAETLVLLRGSAWRPLTAFLVLIGCAAAAVAVLTGTWLASGDDPALKRHELMGWTTLVGALASACLLWVPQRWVLRAAILFTALAAGLTGHLGGLMVYGKDWFSF